LFRERFSSRHYVNKLEAPRLAAATKHEKNQIFADAFFLRRNKIDENKVKRLKGWH
jgi:hypothetical protein